MDEFTALLSAATTVSPVPPDDAHAQARLLVAELGRQSREASESFSLSGGL